MIASLFLFALPVAAAVMSSTSYKVQSDSLNFGGGLSTSTSYKQENTFGEVGTGESASSNYLLHAGYQQMQSIYLSLSVSPVNLTPTIPSTGGGVANGSTNVTVTTDDAAGYELYITASTSPALVSGVNSFADYVPAGADPDFVFAVLSANSGFGFSPEGSDIVSAFKDNGSVCNAGASDAADRCWVGLSTSQRLISKKTSGNHPAGTVTTLKFRAESGATHTQPSGNYTATSTVTAIAL